MDFVGLEKFSLVDYDGKLACTLFAQNCNFKCPFCHNKDLVFSNIQTSLSFNDILIFLKSRIGKLEAVCITGGEPTLMPDLDIKIKQIKELGFKIKLDTNGYRPDVLRKLINENLIDYVAMDIKNSFKKYAISTNLLSIDTNKIQESINILKNSKIDYEFRTTIVNELHNEKDMEEIAEFLKGDNKLFLQKFVNNKNCINQHLTSVSLNKAIKFKNILEKKIKNVDLRGY